MMTQQLQPSRLQQIRMFVSIGKTLAASYVGWTIIISLVVGLLIGWFLLGWVIAPVVYTDAKPSSLSPQYQEVYLSYAADSYAARQVTLDKLAVQLGEGWTKPQVLDRLDQMIKAQRPGADRLSNLRSDLNAYSGEIGPTLVAAPSNALALILLVFLVVIVGGLLLARRRQVAPPSPRVPAAPVAQAGAPVAPEQEARRGAPPAGAPVSYAAGGARPVEKSDWSGEERPPLSQYQTVYAIGDDRYDMSFSIESGTGDFLGECGVGISETIGTGSPSQVTALEVWLFDKNDIRTLTKVLMTEHCYNNAALRAKLAAKGEAVPVRAGAVTPLVTQTLKINARIDNVVYGDADHSYFQQVTIQIGAWSLTI
jgi:hypothetical protein